MIRQSPSIFNDIIGPIMIGPSSSHTCGPSRIGYLCQQLLRGNLVKATVEFSNAGAYTYMYKGQRSDMGFVNGLLGYKPEEETLRNSFNIAKQRGVDIQFILADMPAIVPNICVITMYSDKGERITVHNDSTGAGTVKLLKIDGLNVEIVGDCYEVLINTKGTAEKTEAAMKEALGLFSSYEGFAYDHKSDRGLIDIKQRVDIPEDILGKIKAIATVTDVKVIKPVLLVASNRNTEMPFRSAEEMLAKAKAKNKELWELAVDYEMARAGWTKEQVMEQMKFSINVMEHAVKEALRGDIDMKGIIQPTAGKISEYVRANPKALDMGVLNSAVPWATGTMEYSSAMGVVYCAPTGGSAGVFPGAVLGVANHKGVSMEQKVKAMLTTAVTGIVISKDCNYSAELYGCQVEPGAASAMAAAGLVYLMGGTPEQSAMAASCGIQNILGIICDPVAGMVLIPCVSRNAMSTANAVVCANMIMGGFDPLIPLDEAAETLFRVGSELPQHLRATCTGGLCVTPCGQRLAHEQEERDNLR